MINGTGMRAVLQWSAFDPARGKWAAGCTRDHPDSLSCKRVVGPGVGNTIALPAYSNEPAALVVLSCRQASYPASCRHRHTQKTRLRLRRQSRIHLPFQHIPTWLALVLSGCSPPANVPPRPRARPPNRATRRLLHGKHPRVVPADQLRVLRSSRQPSRAPTRSLITR